MIDRPTSTYLNVVREKILIDAGPSEEGWSRLEAFARCERLWYLTRGRGADAAAPIGDPLVRGSIGHVGLAHEYARRTAAKNGQDPEMYYDRDTAMRLCADKFPDRAQADELYEVARATVDAYFEHYKGENLDVVAVESPVRAVLEDGRGMTQRLDLVIRDLDGRYWIYDHKFVGVDPRASKTVDRYTLSGQFLLMRMFGRAFYGEQFGGVRVNLCGVRTPHVFKRCSPEPAPAALGDFTKFVVAMRKRIAEKEGLGYDAYLPSFNEQVCVTAYGKCSRFEVCQWGR